MQAFLLSTGVLQEEAFLGRAGQQIIPQGGHGAGREAEHAEVKHPMAQSCYI